MSQQDYELRRQQMVIDQIAKRGLNDSRLLTAFESIPRHLFVPQEYLHAAYEDGPLPIGYGQTISQPYIVALMTNLLQLRGDECVLDVGTGSGYQAAILGRLAAQVHTIECVPELAARAKKALRTLKAGNIHLHIGDGSLGWPQAAPYDGILVAAAAPQVPKTLLEQLKDGGRLVLPVGSRGLQQWEVWQRIGSRYETDRILGVAFVPLRGEQGWNFP